MLLLLSWNPAVLKTIDIPMGIDPAFFWADLYHECENMNVISWISELKKDIARAKEFRGTFRFVDDLCAFNYGKKFKSHLRKFTPRNWY